MKIVGTTITGSVLVNGNDVTNNLQNLNVWSGSVASTIVSLNTYTASQNNNNSTYATTGSNTFVGTQYVSNTTEATSFSATSSLYTDGGLRVTKDAYVSGSMYVRGNFTVFGTSSIEYVTSSALVGLEYIDLNTDSPALRYAGIRVYDSGSISGVTGSLFWDSQNNKWIYSNPSTVGYSGGMLISGPRASSLGSEEGTTNNALMKGQGGDHITSSAILDDGTSLRIPYLTIITGTVGATTFSGSGANLTSIPNAALSNSTISGISLGNNLATLTIGTGLTGTSYNGSTGVTIAMANTSFYVGTTSISLGRSSASQTLTGVSIDGSAGNASTVANLTPPQFFNNMGQLHGTYTNFNSYGDFGFRYMQGSTNGPGTGASQYYGMTLGLGSEYSNYGCQLYWNRTSTGGSPYMSVRYLEGGSWGSWSKIYAGYADGITGNLSISGFITATGDITAYYSDARLKENLKIISNPLEKITKLTGYTYNTNKLGKTLLNTEDDNESKVGLVAQDLQKVLPEAVKLAPFDRDENGQSKSGENYLTIQYEKVVPLLVEAIKEQQAQIEELKAKLG